MAHIFAFGVLVGLVGGILAVWLVRILRPELGIIRYYDNKDRHFGAARGYGWVQVRMGRYGVPRMLALTQAEYDKMLERARSNKEDQGAP